jgi:hypothetical protein
MIFTEEVMCRVWGVQTSLTDKNTGNSIKTGFGIEHALYHNLNQAYFNRDRF